MAKPTTKQRLVEAGLYLFRTRGFSATGLSKIVNAAGVPKGSFYHFFPGGKDDFARAVIEAYVEQAARAREDLRDPATGPAMTRLRLHFESLADDFEHAGYSQGCLLGNLAGEVADHSPPLRSALAAGFEAWVDDVAGVIAEALSDHTLNLHGDCHAIARALIAAWEGALLLMKTSRSRDPLDEMIDLWFDALLPTAPDE